MPINWHGARLNFTNKVRRAAMYEGWSREELIARLIQLDPNPSVSSVQGGSSKIKGASKNKPPKASKAFDFSQYPRRKIALKFCYQGWEYNGLAFQSDKTPLPTVEGTLYNALASCKLIDGAAGPEGCGWERCGRTDRGVSSAGQVVSLWVRSNIKHEGRKEAEELTPEANEGDKDLDTNVENKDSHPDSSTAPRPLSGLDLNAMQEAANRLIGEHDFRNLCKVDPSKQISSYRRKILRAEISKASVFADTITNSNAGPQVDRGQPEMCVFDLSGTAFLYNQVRHIMAVLFLVGARLEQPKVVTALLNSDPAIPEPPFKDNEDPPEFVTCKPEYQMADPLPLVLWECAYSDNDVTWQTDNEVNTGVTERIQNNSKTEESDDSIKSIYRQVYSIHERSLVHTTLNAHFLQAVSTFHPPPQSMLNSLSPPNPLSLITPDSSPFLSVPLGGGSARRIAARNYVPLLLRKRLEHVDIVNARWREGKGGRRAEAGKVVPKSMLEKDQNADADNDE
ncbi:tRNA pseudouridine synthase [Pyrrhoderma noxium]|uniref:tRNA pseudouridine synthase n=1 Tax=Pyrrhoderma noxium TaxID=2282107 RepID=A0A286U833_9AGAM|nr:tRNA pseudouridine synthase [Pyrrhoderma noxium]